MSVSCVCQCSLFPKRYTRAMCTPSLFFWPTETLIYFFFSSREGHLQQKSRGVLHFRPGVEEGGGGLNPSQQRRPLRLGKALSIRLLSMGGKSLCCLTFICKIFMDLSLNHLVSHPGSSLRVLGFDFSSDIGLADIVARELLCH